MQATRRDLISMTGAATAGVLAGGLVDGGLDGRPAAAQALTSVWPHLPLSASALRSSRRLFAMWHGHAVSSDNLDPFPNLAANAGWAQEAYNRMMNPAADPEFTAVGGLTRQRPLPRAPRPESDWQVSDMKQDIQQAAALGIDGFFYNVIGYQRSGFWYTQMQAMFEAARQLNIGFTISLNLDGAVGLPSAAEVASFVGDHAGHPAMLRLPDGRLVLGSFNPEVKGAAWWQELRQLLANRGITVCFVFSFYNWEAGYAMLASIGDVLGVMVGRFGELSNAVGRPGYAGRAEQAATAGKKFINTITTQDFRPKTNNYYENGGGSAMFREGWKTSDTVKADWTMLMSWNDRTEATELAPSTGTQYGFYDLAAWYAAKYKTGKDPMIVRDVLFYYHRVQHTQNTTLARQATRFASIFNRAPVNQIELLAFLTAPATLEIELNGVVVGRADVAAGLQVVTAPLGFGRPVFRLRRNGTTTIRLDSAFDIRAAADYQDLVVRSGSSRRIPVPMVANLEFTQLAASLR